MTLNLGIASRIANSAFFRRTLPSAGVALVLASAFAMPASAVPSPAQAPLARAAVATSVLKCPAGYQLVRYRIGSLKGKAKRHAIIVGRGKHRAFYRCVLTQPQVVPTPTPSPTVMPTPTATPSVPAPEGWRAEMLNAVNAVRAQNGAAAVRACPALDRSAQGYAELMARTGTFSHTGPDGTQPWDRMRAAGYSYRAASENIAYGYASVASVMDGWVKSSGHFANLISKSVTDAGFGQAADSQGRIYWVQNFGAGGACG